MTRRKHKRCATPGCHNIVPYGSKKGAVCGTCEPKPPPEEAIEEEQLDSGLLAQRLGEMKL